MKTNAGLGETARPRRGHRHGLGVDRMCQPPLRKQGRAAAYARGGGRAVDCGCQHHDDENRGDADQRDLEHRRHQLRRLELPSRGSGLPFRRHRRENMDVVRGHHGRPGAYNVAPVPLDLRRLARRHDNGLRHVGWDQEEQEHESVGLAFHPHC
ncbi:unnamed protein product, partial [Ectocarpus sp. 6 AP-2014]